MECSSSSPADETVVERGLGTIDLFLTAALPGRRPTNFSARLTPMSAGGPMGLVLTDVGGNDAAVIAGPDALARLSSWIQRALAD